MTRDEEIPQRFSILTPADARWPAFLDELERARGLQFL